MKAIRKLDALCISAFLLFHNHMLHKEKSYMKGKFSKTLMIQSKNDRNTSTNTKVIWNIKRIHDFCIFRRLLLLVFTI